MARRTLPAPIVPQGKKPIGIKNDPDAWGALVLLIGSPASKVLTYLEHLEFLASAKEGGFKMIIEIWNDVGWWLVGAFGLMWFLNRWSKKTEQHENGPTWSFVAAAVFMAAIFSSIVTVQFSGVLPNVLVAKGIQNNFVDGHANYIGCNGQIDGTSLVSFSKEYKTALICAPLDAQQDQLSDKRIAVSPLFEIVPGLIPIIATGSPSGDFTISSPNIRIDYFAVLVPRELEWKKIDTLGDLRRQGGKILDSRYYQ